MNPFTSIGGSSVTSNRPRTWRWVRSLMRSRPGGAVCSIRAARFTTGPRMAVLGLDAAAQQHAAGVDAHPQLHLGSDGTGDLRLGHRVEDGESGPHTVLGAVLRCGAHAEHGQQPVAGVLEDPTAVALDLGRAPLQHGVGQLVDVLQVELVGQRGGPDDVDEAHGGRAEVWAVGALGRVVELGQLGAAGVRARRRPPRRRGWPAGPRAPRSPPRGHAIEGHPTSVAVRHSVVRRSSIDLK